MTTLYASETQGDDPFAESVSNPSSRRSRRSGWLWLTIICTLFASSGVIRIWQDRRFESAKNRMITSPFALSSFPTKVGSWEAAEQDETLDEEIARIAGSTDSLIRTYVDEATGVRITLLLLYGRAERLTGHTPEVCYPAAGFEMASGDIVDNTIRSDSGVLAGIAAVFRGELFAKRGGVLVDREEVFYSFRHDNRWSPSVDGNWRALRFSPGVYKLQIQRRVAETERRHLNNPSLAFIKSFLPEFEKMLNSSSNATPTKAAVDNAQPKS